METTNTKIIDKIKKLLVMADRATQHERETAYFMAQTLMAKHHLAMEDVVGKDAEKIEAKRSFKVNATNEHIRALAGVIAKNFRCKTYFSYGKGAKFIAMAFYGYESDATIALAIFEDAAKFAKAQAERIAHQVYNKEGSCAGVRDEWLYGFTKGIDEGFAEQVQSSSETALMVVVPQEVHEAFNTIEFSKEQLSLAGSRRNGDRLIREAGYQNGKAFAHGKRQGAIE